MPFTEPIMFTAHADLGTVVGSGDIRGLARTQLRFDLVIDDRSMLRYEILPRPLMLPWTRRVTGFIRSDGLMYDTDSDSPPPFDLEDPGALGVKLPANDPRLELDRLQYRVTVFAEYAGQTLPLRPFYFDAPPDDRNVYMALESPPPGQPFGRGRAGFGIREAVMNGPGRWLVTREDGSQLESDIGVSPRVAAAYSMTFGRI